MDDLTLEESFPELRMSGEAHIRGNKKRGPILAGSSNLSLHGSNTKKHGNKKKREKIRRIFTET